MFILWKWIGADGGKNQGGVRGRSDGKQCRDKFHGIYADGFGKCSMFPLCGCFFPFSDGLFLAGSSLKTDTRKLAIWIWNGRNGAYDDTVCAVDYKRWMGLEKKCVADNGMAFGNAAGDSFVLDGAADERCGRTGRWLLFSDHWVLSGGMADA